VNAGTQYVAESVTFLNLLASDKTIGDLVAEGIKGKSYNVVDGAIYRTEDRAGWSIWRYGIVGDTSGATPFWSTDEWTDMKSFNDSAAALPIAGWLFDRSSVDEEVGRCTAIIDKYCIALGVGASNKYNAFIAELKAAGIDKVVKEAQRQYAAYAAVANAARKVDTQYISMRLNSAKAIYSENNNFKVISADPNNAKVAPFTLLGKTMVPVRFLTNFTGVKVKYDSKTMGTTLSYKGITLTLALNAKTMKKVVGKATTNVTLSTPATMVEGKTYIPMRAVAEALGFSVKYDSLSDVIVVSESKLKGAEYDIVNNAGKLELPAGRITIATISAAKTTLSLKKGQSQSLTKSDIIFKPSNASCKLLTYKSSNTKVAEVSTVGKITAKAKGTATITITSNNGKTAKITVKVS
jgi:uncharacterized protein YjdB